MARRALVMTGVGTVLVAAVAIATVRAHDPVTTRVTWNGEISRIVRARCASCHAEGRRAPMSLMTFREARPWAKAIKEEVLTRRMPKWHAARGYGAFSNDPSLSPFEIALCAAWGVGGAPAGAPSAVAGASQEDPEPAVRPEPTGSRDVAVECEGPLPEGTLLAVRPLLAPRASAGFAAKLPDGRVEVIVWIRDFEPDFVTTYRLRTPLGLPRGSRLLSQRASEPVESVCSVMLTMAPPR